jgi:hypothetical protein
MYVGHVLVLFMALVWTHFFVLFVALVLVRLLVLFVTLIKLTFVFCGLFFLSSCGLHGGGAHCDSGQGDGSCEFFISFFSLWLGLCLFYWFFSWHCFCFFLGPLCGLGSHLSFCPLCVLILVLLLILLMALVFNSY